MDGSFTFRCPRAGNDRVGALDLRYHNIMQKGPGMLAPKKLFAGLLILSLSLSTPYVAAAGVAGKTYCGTVNLKTPQGHKVPYYWILIFNHDGTTWLNASGAGSPGSYSGNTNVEVDVNNKPYYSWFKGKQSGYTFRVTKFTDRDGNSLWNEAVLYQD